MKVQSAFDDDGIALDANYEQFVVRFLDEYEWYARALKAARESNQCKDDVPVQQALCREP
jgi:hypothetical protein